MTISRRDVLKHPARKPLIAASILSADFGRMAEECRGILEAGADLLHLDVMDGHFVPNLTMGPDLCAAVRRHCPGAFLDVHLMVTNPRQHVKAFAEAGADHLTIHVETADLGVDVAAVGAEIRGMGLSAGIAINPPTAVEKVLPMVSGFDMVLVMSVNPGYAGQAFMGEVLGKVKVIAGKLGAEQRLEMDGGINGGNAGRCVEAGCDVIAAASSVFGARDRAGAIAGLRGK